MQSAPRWTPFVIAVLLVVSAIAPVGVGIATGPAAAAEPQSLSLANNTTEVAHENPDIRREDQNLQGLQRWLSGRMGEVLMDCTEGAVADRSGVCDLNTSYPAYLERYVDLAGETNAEKDDESAEVFEEADDHQRKFNDDANSFYETREEFQQARQNNDTQRQREVARNLLRQARDVNQSSDVLLVDYENITQLPGVDMENGTRDVLRVQTDAQETIELLEDLYFIETDLTARGLSETASYTDPMPIQGRLTMGNGTAIDNRSIRLSVGNRRVTVRTNSTGWFRTQYRPKFTSVDRSSIPVRYLPRNDSLYLPSETSVAVKIEQVTPTVTVTVQPATAGFTDVVRISGNVSADGRPVGNVPLNLTVGDGRPVTVRTSGQGEFARQVSIPVTLNNGFRTVGAEIQLENRAIGPGRNTTRLNVTTTATNITIAAETVSARNVVVSGRVTTAAGPPAGNQPVGILVGDRLVEVTRTNASGYYRTPITVPLGAMRNESKTSVRLVARYKVPGTNLGPSRAMTNATVSLTPTPTETDQPPNATETPSPVLLPEILPAFPILNLPFLDWLPGLWALFAIVLLLVALIALLLLARRRDWRLGTGGPASTEAGEPSEALEQAITQIDLEDAEPPTLLELARDRIEAGAPARGIEAGYLAIRRDLEERLGNRAPQTHWEFYAACAAADLEDAEVDALQQLTEAYERAIFSPSGISQEDADSVLTTADSLFDSLRESV